MNANLRTKEPVPCVDETQQESRVEGPDIRNVGVLQRRHPAEGVDEVGIRREVVVECLRLFFASSCAEIDNNVLDLFGWLLHDCTMLTATRKGSNGMELKLYCRLSVQKIHN